MKTTISLLFIILLGGNIMSQIKSNTYEQVAVNTTNSKFAKLKPIPVTAVTMYEGFWNKRIQANTDNSILKLLELLESHGVVDNFRRMYKSPDIKRKGYRFTDSDIYKWMEAASYAVIYDKSGKIKVLQDLRRALCNSGPALFRGRTWFAKNIYFPTFYILLLFPTLK